MFFDSLQLISTSLKRWSFGGENADNILDFHFNVQDSDTLSPGYANVRSIKQGL